MSAAPSMAGKRVCVIGAGPSGCSALRAFQSAKEKGAEIPEVVCFEKQAVPSGLWNFTWRTGLDHRGEPIHGSQYRHLWSNGPKECLEFADYTFKEHFGVAIPSYPPREVLIDYINGRIEKAGVKKWIRFNSIVRDCSFDEASSKFTVRVQDETNKEYAETFDWVICCSGHFSTPNVPEFEGLHTFTGRVMHSHDYRNAEEFAGQNVLIIGTSYSAEDIASQCYKFGAKSLTLSWRTAPMGYHWPDNFKTVPLLTSVNGRTCTFKDGQTAEIDAIIMCTGYLHHFPFMRQNLRLQTSNRLWINSLHEGVVWPDNSRLFYVGMQDQWLTFNMFDAQAWYARDVILGRISLPDRETMDQEWKKMRDAEDALDGSDESMIRYQCDHTKHLIEMTDYPSFDMEGVVKMFLDWEHNKHENIMTFRDYPHTSVMDGTVAPVHHTPWLKAMDDSIPCFVQQPKKDSAAPSMAGKRVCVIGAGPSGCSALRAFQSAKEKGAEIPEVVCFEKQAVPSGLWNFTWRTGLDHRGEPIHGSQYRHLWSNGPKECLEFADYTFKEHFGVAIPSYPPREVLIDYINGRIEKAGVKKWIRFNSIVRDCSFDEASSKFTVRVQDETNKEYAETFDWVICCSGHFSTPNVPEFEGLHTFTGRVMHSHDYRNAEEFAGQNVLIIGTSYSAEDIASQCYKFGAKSLTLSWRTAPMGYHWPDNFKTVPLLTSVNGRTCTFKDGQTAEIDAIIMCTGYLHHFPFMRQNLRLQTSNRLWINSLHEGVVWPDNTGLFYVGMQDQWLTFNMFDAQAWYARDVILGRISLPDRATMDQEWKKMRDAEDALDGSDESMIRYQCDHTKHLIEMTDYPSFDMEGVVKMFLDWEHNKHENIMTFRDYPHTSVMDGTVAPVHHTPWLKAMDDSIPCFVEQVKKD